MEWIALTIGAIIGCILSIGMDNNQIPGLIGPILFFGGLFLFGGIYIVGMVLGIGIGYFISKYIEF